MPNVLGYVRLDPRVYKKLSKLADKHNLVLRDYINFVLEENEEEFPKYAEALEKLIEEDEEEEETDEAEEEDS